MQIEGAATCLSGNTLEVHVPSATTSLKLDSDLKERVARLAQGRRRSSHWIMREAIDVYVTREEEREEINRATLAAIEEFEANGLHLAEQEADAWFAKLEAGEYETPPPCHR